MMSRDSITRFRPRTRAVTLSVVAGSAAIAPYERAGFVPYGREPRALTTEAGYVDQILMIRIFERPAPPG